MRNVYIYLNNLEDICIILLTLNYVFSLHFLSKISI